MVLMEALDHQKKKLIWTLLKQTQNFVSDYIVMLITVIYLLMKKKFLNFKLTIKVLTFQLDFV